MKNIFLYNNNLIFKNPSGYISYKQIKLFFLSIKLISIIIVPTLLLIGFFSFLYKNNIKKYKPEWSHSKIIETIIWSLPIIIIIILSILTIYKTSELDPKNNIKYNNIKPIIVNVIASDWKWIFIINKFKIISINELILPINIPIIFKITSLYNMNSFYIPKIGGQIYAMPKMQSKLNSLINIKGIFNGYSSNYSGWGFSHMKFKIYNINHNKFNNWINFTKKNKNKINKLNLIKLIKHNIQDKNLIYNIKKFNLYKIIYDKFN